MGPSQYKDNIPLETQGSNSPTDLTMTQIMETTDIEAIELDLTGLSTNNSDDKIHYRQNTGQTSPRAAKYREGASKGKFAKFITVPDEKTEKEKSSHRGASSVISGHESSHSRGAPMIITGSETSRSQGAPTVISGHGTTRSRGAPSFVGSVPSTNYHPGHEGTMRGLPSSWGTVSGRRNKPAYRSWNGTVQNGNLPNGHIPRTGTLAFRRGGIERKEQFVKHFSIEVDKHVHHRYSPGEEISGKIVYDVARNLEIRFIEFQIIGHCAITTINSMMKSRKTKVDKFLCKRKYMVGTPDGRYTSLITPGHYVSNFRFKLPQGIPSTVMYEDNRNGFSAEIIYMLKVRICDDVGSASARSNHSLNNMVKVLLSRRLNFTVRQPFDIHSVPFGLTPIMHTEDIQLSCSGVAIIDLSLDRTCFIAGDNIRVHLETQRKYARKIKSITCELQQRVSVLANKFKAVYAIAIVEDKNPRGVKSHQSKEKVLCYDIIMPTQLSLLPSILPGCRTLHVTYTIVINIKFKSCSGKLTMEIPISVGPSMDSSNLLLTNSIPQFNKPVRRFPNFNRNGENHTPLPADHGPHIHSKYTNEGCAALLCCLGNENVH